VAERLNQLVPGKSPKKTFLANSGAEAVENAIRSREPTPSVRPSSASTMLSMAAP